MEDDTNNGGDEDNTNNGEGGTDEGRRASGGHAAPNGNVFVHRATEIKLNGWGDPDVFHGTYPHLYPFRRGGNGHYKNESKKSVSREERLLSIQTGGRPHRIRRFKPISDNLYTLRALDLAGGLFENDWQ